MKELDPINNPKEEIHIVQDEKQKQEYRFIGSMILYKGAKLWSFNEKTLELKEEKINAQVDQVVERKLTLWHIVNQIPLKPTITKKAAFKPDCMYVLATNANNAKKKFNKYLPKEFQFKIKKKKRASKTKR